MMNKLRTNCLSCLLVLGLSSFVAEAAIHVSEGIDPTMTTSVTVDSRMPGFTVGEVGEEGAIDESGTDGLTINEDLQEPSSEEFQIADGYANIYSGSNACAAAWNNYLRCLQSRYYDICIYRCNEPKRSTSGGGYQQNQSKPKCGGRHGPGYNPC